MAEKRIPNRHLNETESKCPFETNAIVCGSCGGVANVYQAGPGLTEVHCDECGAHYNQPSHISSQRKKH